MVVLALCLIAFGAFSSPALAVKLHGLEFSFDGTGSTAGPFSGALGAVAIDQTSGSVYVMDRGNGVIDKFDAGGAPQAYTALGTSSLNVPALCPGFGYSFGDELDDVAVDNSSGPNQGNIYVGSYGPGVCAFDAVGNFLWHLTGEGGPAGGLDVDGAGHLWMASYAGGIREFENTGSPPELLNIVPVEPDQAGRVAIDAFENIFVLQYFGGVDRYRGTGFQNGIEPYSADFPSKALAVDPSTNHLYVASPTVVREYTSMGTRLSETGLETLNAARGVEVNGTTGKIYVSDKSAGRVFVFSALKEFAAVTTGQASNVRRTTASALGHVDPDGGGDITGCHVEYGLDKTYGNSAPCDAQLPISSPADVTAQLSGLSPATTYHFRLFATDSSGTNKGQDLTLTTPFVSGVRAESASSITRTDATLNGSLDPENINTSYYFQWGLTIGYGNTQPTGPPGESLGSTPGQTPVAANIEDLAPATTYHYRLVGVNSEGKTLGKDATFTTSPPITALSTAPPTDIGPNSATLNGSLDPDGFDTSYYYEWGQTTSYGNVTPALPGADAGSAQGVRSVPVEISGLDVYSAYHYRLVATNIFGTTIGKDVAFLSTPPFLPSVDGTEAHSITANGAVLGASINPGFGPTVFRFQYGPDSSYGSRTALSAPIGADGTDHAVSVEIGGLQAATTYHYRAVAINFSGSSPGPDRTFTTAGLPSIDSTSVFGVTQTSVRLSAQIGPNSSPTTYRIEYGTDPLYGARTGESVPIGSDTGLHAVTSDIVGLNAGTTYHFRVVATNGIGTVLGPDRTFTTATPAVTESHRCKRGFTKRRGRCVRAHKRKRQQKTQSHRRAGR